MIKLWAGEDISSFHLVLSAQAKVEALRASAGMTAGMMDTMMAELPPLWRHEGGTAVIEVQGPLVAGSAGWMRLFGVLGYDDLAKAVIEAASHENTKRMLYHINTPGGDVTGLIEMGELLGQVSAMVPSATHTSEQMCSAGYWLASSIKNNYITTGPVAAVGSIGVLKLHRDVSQQLANDGVKMTVLRSGKYKAEINPIEPLTEAVQGRAEAQLADVHNMFRAQVAKGRPQLSAEELAEVTEGQVYLGARAVKAGLADKVGSFDLALKLLDKRKHSRDTSSNSKGKAMNLTPEQLAAIAAGTPLQAFGLNTDGTAMSAEEITAYTDKVAADAAAATAAAAAAAAPAITQPADADKGVVALLQEQLASANAKVVALSVAADKHTAMAASFDGLLTIARKATANMLIPMGGTSAAVDGMDAAAIVAEHARVQPLFLEKFKAGQVTKNPAEAPAASQLPPGFAAACKSAPTA